MVLPGSCKMRGSCFGATLLLVARGATGAEDVPWAKDVAKGQVVLKSFVKTGSAVVHERLRAADDGARQRYTSCSVRRTWGD